MTNNKELENRSITKRVGTIGMGAIGAALGGIVAGPIGAVVGGVIGAVSARSGENSAPKDEAKVEEEYWRKNFLDRDYVQTHQSYETYAPAYRAGYQGFNQTADTEKSFEEIEPQLRQVYEQSTPDTRLDWNQAKHAARDAYMRLYEERLVAGKQRVKTGEVAIAKHVETDTARVDVPIEKERVVIERTAPNHQSNLGDDAFQEGQMARMEVFEETPDIHKEAFVREEVRVRKEIEQDIVTAEEQVRHEELDITTDGQPVVESEQRS
jgi:uncharacterized protein (TIGR02271 family)